MAADRALVFKEAGAVGPGTHVLIFGIGDYPFLLGGRTERPEISEGMGQAKSPPRSAAALADWFLDGGFRNPDSPLHSLSLIVSDTRPVTYRGQAIPRGTIDDAMRAISKWLERASTNPDNQVIFSFAGHGVSTGATLLLMRDYGRPPGNRFDGAMNFDLFRSAMETRTPGYQVFLIDACRSPSALARLVIGRTQVGRDLLEPSEDERTESARQSIHHATSPLEEAFGQTEGLGIYTEAILRALGGGGAQPNLGFWVGTDGLSMALSAYTTRIAAGLDVKQVPQRVAGVSFKIHQPQNLEVPVYVTCVPEDVWNEKIHFQASRAGAPPKMHQHDPAVEPGADHWSLVLPYREHHISARFEPAAPFQDVVDHLFLPGLPEVPVALSVARKGS